jgi:hypothetical protein
VVLWGKADPSTHLRPDEKAAGLGILTTIELAMTGPMMGTSTRRRQTSSERWKAFSFFSSWAMRGANAVNSSPSKANNSLAGTGTVVSAAMLSSSGLM